LWNAECCASCLGCGAKPHWSERSELHAFGFLALAFCLCAEGTGFGFLPKAVTSTDNTPQGGKQIQGDLIQEYKNKNTRRDRFYLEPYGLD